jgi:NADH-quinone oxidoreductase subunit N
VNDVDELAGLARTRPGVAIAIAVFMFSLAGIPPLAGFWGKLNLFSAALQNTVTMDVAASQPGVLALRNWLLALVIVGVLNAAIAAAYYLRIIAVMYFRPSIAVPKGQGGWGAGAATFAAALATVAIGLYPVKLIDESTKAGASVYDERAKPAADVQVAER